MSEKDYQVKAKEVLEMVRSQKEACHKAFVRTTVIYILLALFVIGYTSYIYYQATTLITPSTIAQMLVNSANAHIPALRAGFNEQMKPVAEHVATQSIDNIKQAIPNASAYAKNLIKAHVDEAVNEFETNNLPVVQQHLDNAMTSVLTEKDKAKDGQIGELLADEVVSSAEIELDKILSKDFYQSMSDLEKNLDGIRMKPAAKMTRQEYAEVMFIDSWIRLTEIAKTGENSGVLTVISAFSNQAVSSVAENLSKSMDKSLQKK